MIMYVRCWRVLALNLINDTHVHCTFVPKYLCVYAWGGVGEREIESHHYYSRGEKIRAPASGRTSFAPLHMALDRGQGWQY